MTTFAQPFDSIVTTFNSVDWRFHRERLLEAAHIGLDYLASAAVTLLMAALLLGRAFTYVRRNLPTWLRAIAQLLDSLNTWLDQQATTPATPAAHHPLTALRDELTALSAAQLRRQLGIRAKRSKSQLINDTLAMPI